MATRNSINLSATVNADGYDLSGGTTARKLTVTGADITLTGSGSAVYTFPGSTDTVATLAANQALTNKTYNGNTWTAGTGTLTIAAGKTLTANNNITIAGTDGKSLTVSNNLTLAGTDGTTMTFPATSATVARTDAANTFTGIQSMTSPVITGAAATTQGARGYDATNLAMLVGDGTAIQTMFTSAWKSFTPSWTNLTVGSGTNTGAYCQVGKLVVFRIYFKFGSGSAVGTVPALTLPVSAATYGTVSTVIASFYGKSGGVGFTGIMFQNGSVYAHNTSGTYGNVSNITATAPGTWTTNDEIMVQACYEAA